MLCNMLQAAPHSEELGVLTRVFVPKKVEQYYAEVRMPNGMLIALLQHVTSTSYKLHPTAEKLRALARVFVPREWSSTMQRCAVCILLDTYLSQAMSQW
jgi:hypothetical protein